MQYKLLHQSTIKIKNTVSRKSYCSQDSGPYAAGSFRLSLCYISLQQLLRAEAALLIDSDCRSIYPELHWSDELKRLCVRRKRSRGIPILCVIICLINQSIKSHYQSTKTGIFKHVGSFKSTVSVKLCSLLKSGTSLSQETIQLKTVSVIIQVGLVVSFPALMLDSSPSKSNWRKDLHWS